MHDDDPAYQLLTRASGFLEAAEIVVTTAGNKPVLRAPITHLISHALEVLMKHVLVLQGHSLEQVRSKYGHSISELWSANEMTGFRSFSARCARETWELARKSGKYEDSFSENPEDVLVAAVDELARLHSGRSDYALRYVARTDEMVPNPIFLLETFRPVKNEVVREYFQSERARSYA